MVATSFSKLPRPHRVRERLLYVCMDFSDKDPLNESPTTNGEVSRSSVLPSARVLCPDYLVRWLDREKETKTVTECCFSSASDRQTDRH